MARLSARDGRRVDARRRPGPRHRSDRRARLRPRLADGGLDDRLRQPPPVASSTDAARPARGAPARRLRRRHRRLAVRDQRLRAGRQPRRRRTGWRDCAQRLGRGRHRAHPRFRPEPHRVRASVGPPPSRTGSSTPTPRSAPRIRTSYFEVRSDGRHWIAHGRDPNFPPWTDTAQLDYRHPDVPRAMTQTLREVATRCDGVVCSMAMLVLDDVFRVDLGRPVGRAGGGRGRLAVRRVLVARHERGPRRLPDVPAHRRGVLGPRMAAPAARLRLHLRHAAARPARWPAIAARSPAHLRADDALPASVGPPPRGPQRAADRRADDARAGAGRGPRRGDRARDAARPRRPDRRRPGRRPGPVPARARRADRTRPCTTSTAGCCGPPTTRRSGSARRSASSRPSAWPGNATHEGIVARLWVGQHRQLRLAVANLTGEPAQAYIPLALPEFAGKTVRLEDQLDDDRLRPAGRRPARAAACTSTCPPYGGHLFRVTRQTTPASGPPSRRGSR